MARIARPDTDSHTTTARTWWATLSDGRRIQFSASEDELAKRLTAEARSERTTITGFGPTFPIPVIAGRTPWVKLHGEITIKLTGTKAMVLADAQGARRAAA